MLVRVGGDPLDDRVEQCPGGRGVVAGDPHRQGRGRHGRGTGPGDGLLSGPAVGRRKDNDRQRYSGTSVGSIASATGSSEAAVTAAALHVVERIRAGLDRTAQLVECGGQQFGGDGPGLLRSGQGLGHHAQGVGLHQRVPDAVGDPAGAGPVDRCHPVADPDRRGIARRWSRTIASTRSAAAGSLPASSWAMLPWCRSDSRGSFRSLVRASAASRSICDSSSANAPRM